MLSINKNKQMSLMSQICNGSAHIQFYLDHTNKNYVIEKYYVWKLVEKIKVLVCNRKKIRKIVKADRLPYFLNISIMFILLNTLLNVRYKLMLSVFRVLGGGMNFFFLRKWRNNRAKWRAPYATWQTEQRAVRAVFWASIYIFGIVIIHTFAMIKIEGLKIK